MALKQGDRAPEFTLKDQNHKEVKLSDLRGRKVLVSFHPLAFTPVCATQMKNLEESYDQFLQLNTVALGVSVDSMFSKAAWAKELGIEKTPLLADFGAHGAVAQAFGVLRSDGFSERAVFIINEEGIISFAKVYPIKELPDMQEIVAALK